MISPMRKARRQKKLTMSSKALDVAAPKAGGIRVYHIAPQSANHVTCGARNSGTQLEVLLHSVIPSSEVVNLYSMDVYNIYLPPE